MRTVIIPLLLLGACAGRPTVKTNDGRELPTAKSNEGVTVAVQCPSPGMRMGTWIVVEDANVLRPVILPARASRDLANRVCFYQLDPEPDQGRGPSPPTGPEIDQNPPRRAIYKGAAIDLGDRGSRPVLTR